MKRKILSVLCPALAALALTGCIECKNPSSMTAKPVIYLYPTEQEQVRVQLDFDGELTTTYPPYEDGWEVLASPDGTLVNLADGKEYSYLFWEGETDTVYDLSKGWCVHGEDTMAFLQQKLSEIGLTPKEYNEFIVYWLPMMENNAYNLISFQQETYTDSAELTVSPQPDSVLRVFMAWKPLEQPVDIPPQELNGSRREGFTLVEWGGTELS